MKKAVFIGLFIFSIAVNLAVAATVGWHLWWQSRAVMESRAATSGGPALTREDFQAIRQMCPREARIKMMEVRNNIMAKNLEILEIISKHPGDIGPADKKINELQQLKGQMDREAFSRISKIFAGLPDEKRQTFAVFVRDRACMGPGMGMRGGRGPGCGPRGMGACPMQSE